MFSKFGVPGSKKTTFSSSSRRLRSWCSSRVLSIAAVAAAAALQPASARAFVFVPSPEVTTEVQARTLGISVFDERTCCAFGTFGYRATLRSDSVIVHADPFPALTVRSTGGSFASNRAITEIAYFFTLENPPRSISSRWGVTFSIEAHRRALALALCRADDPDFGPMGWSTRGMSGANTRRQASSAFACASVPPQCNHRRNLESAKETGYNILQST
jgi:hypothetical protein